jgi:hypothetical protein
VEACAAAFARGVQAVYASTAVAIHFNSPTHIVASWYDGNQAFKGVDACITAFLIDSWEVVNEGFFVEMSAIEEHKIGASFFHFGVYGTGYAISWC